MFLQIWWQDFWNQYHCQKSDISFLSCCKNSLHCDSISTISVTLVISILRNFHHSVCASGHLPVCCWMDLLSLFTLLYFSALWFPFSSLYNFHFFFETFYFFSIQYEYICSSLLKHFLSRFLCNSLSDNISGMFVLTSIVFFQSVWHLSGSVDSGFAVVFTKTASFLILFLVRPGFC